MYPQLDAHCHINTHYDKHVFYFTHNTPLRDKKTFTRIYIICGNASDHLQTRFIIGPNLAITYSVTPIISSFWAYGYYIIWFRITRYQQKEKNIDSIRKWSMKKLI